MTAMRQPHVQTVTALQKRITDIRKIVLKLSRDAGIYPIVNGGDAAAFPCDYPRRLLPELTRKTFKAGPQQNWGRLFFWVFLAGGRPCERYALGPPLLQIYSSFPNLLGSRDHRALASSVVGPSFHWGREYREREIITPPRPARSARTRHRGHRNTQSLRAPPRVARICGAR